MMEQLTLGGGCFWCLEAVYENVIGVTAVESGYSNGETLNPTYQQVCSGSTGHAEVVQISYDPEMITMDELLDIFWQIHDPTSLNRQGADVGTQYRSGIYYESETQKTTAEASIEKAQSQFASPIVTEVEALQNYFPAEAYHQHYYANNPNQGYCQVVVAPKVEKFYKGFPDRVK